ncbi:MAG: hypothetical protein ACXVGC_00265 [Mycobacteriaceae bacterium]
MADPDEALIEAIAEAMWLDDLSFDGLTVEVASAEFPWPPEEGLADAYRHSARAAYAAVVAHLELVEETRIQCGQPVGEFLGHPMACGACQFIRPGACGVEIRKTRLVSRWTEVDHGSE